MACYLAMWHIKRIRFKGQYVPNRTTAAHMSTKLWYLVLAWGRGVQSSNYLDVEDDQENERDDVSKHSVGSNEINVIVKWVFPQTCRFDCVPECKGHNISHSNAKLQPIKAKAEEKCIQESSYFVKLPIFPVLKACKHSISKSIFGLAGDVWFCLYQTWVWINNCVSLAMSAQS